MEVPASVDSKPLTERLKFFRCNTYEKTGEGAQLFLTRIPKKYSGTYNAIQECPNAGTYPIRVTEHESQTSPDPVEVTLLFRNQQILREGPLVVDPLGIAAKSRARCHLRNFLSLVFDGAFRPDRFVLAKHEQPN